MKHTRIVLAVFVSLLFCQGLHAAPEGKWNLVHYAPNNGNTWFGGSVAGDETIMVVGSQAGQSGGSEAVLKRSTNGGQSFTGVTIPSNGGMMTVFTDVHVVSKDLAWVVGMEFGIPNLVGGPVWKVTNQGRDAEMQVLIWGQFPECWKIHCIDANRCWVACSEGLVGYTTDGGANWKTATLPTTDLTPGAIFFLDPLNGWLVAHKTETTGEGENRQTTILNRGMTFRTTNGGQTWTAIGQEERQTYSHLVMVSTQIGFLAAFDGSRAYLMRTLNGGQTWFILPLPPNKTNSYGSFPLYTLGGIHFFDENRGWAAASYGEEGSGMGSILHLFYTENQGDNWSEHGVWYLDAGSGQEQIAPGLVMDIAFINEHRGYAFGDAHLVARWDDGQFEPPQEDGDAPDGDGPADGDGGEDGDVDTGPVYTGAPGEPCPVPGQRDTYEIPRCDPEQGAPVCAWAEGVDAHCTDLCTYNEDCRKFGPDSCCKVVNFEGSRQGVCLIEPRLCPVYPEDWGGYAGALMGEPCRIRDNATWASFPTCDKNHGGTACIFLPDEPPTFCSMPCTEDADCTGGFTEKGCCNLEVGTDSYCKWDARCNPDWVPDWEDPDSDGDAPDGDLPDGDEPTDGDDGSGATEGGKGGCAGAAGGPMLLLALAGLWAWRRR